MAKNGTVLKAVVVFAVLATRVWASEEQRQVENRSQGGAAVVQLRSQGPAGLDRALARYDTLQAKLVALDKETAKLYERGYESNKERLVDLEREMADTRSR